MLISKTQSLNKQFHSLMVSGIILCLILVIGCVCVPSYIVFNRVTDIKRQILLRDIKTIDNELNAAKSEVMLTAINNSSLSRINKNPTELQRHQAKRELANYFQDIVSRKSIFAMYSYSIPKDIYISAFQESLHISEQNKLKNFVKTYDETNAMWSTVEIGGKNYLNCILGYVHNKVGVLIDLEAISGQELSESLGDSFCILDETGRVLVEINSNYSVLNEIREEYKNPLFSKFFIIREKSNVGNLQIVIAYPRKEILEGFYPLIYILSGICIMILGGMLYMLRIIKKMSLDPMQELLKGLDAIGRSDFDYKIRFNKTYEEYNILGNTFNELSERLRHLQKDIYEKTISEQKLKLQYHRLQIRPHFLYNSLNIVCNLIQMKREEEARKLCICLVKYFRHVLQDGKSLVFLRDEIEHAKNFAAIYEFRYSGKIRWSFDVEYETFFIRIPSLMIHTLLENVVKHTFNGNQELEVKVSAFLEKRKSKERMVIRVKDNGPGFSQKALEEIGEEIKEESVFKDRKEKIGLLNISQRLNLVYGPDAKICCFNDSSGGACIELFIPVDVGEGDTEIR